MHFITAYDRSLGSSGRSTLALLIAYLLLIPASWAQQTELKVESHFHHYGDGSRTLEAKIFEKTTDGLIPRNDVLCNLYLTEISRGGMMGSLITDENGAAVFPLVNKFRAAKDTISEFRFIIRIANDERFVPIDDTTIFQKAEMTVDYIDENENKGLAVRLFHLDEDGDQIPIKGMVVRHFVSKGNELIPINGDGSLTTDQGESLTLFNEQIEGDTAGNLEIITRMSSPVYGSFEERRFMNWGSKESPGKAKWLSFFQSNSNFSTVLIVLILVLPTVALFFALALVLDRFISSKFRS